LIVLVVLMAFTFVWQRIKMQNLTEDIKRMDTEVRQLEKNRDYLKGEILHLSSLEQIKHRAENQIGLKNSEEGELVTYSDSLLTILKIGKQNKPGNGSAYARNLAITSEADNPAQGRHPDGD